MAVIRGPRPDSNYFITPRAYARDWRLSLKEKGALMYMMSHSENYDLTTEQMIAESADGRDSVQTALQGLEAKGYLVRVQRRAAKAGEDANRSGTFQGYDYQITDPPPLPVKARKPRRTKKQATVTGLSGDGEGTPEAGSTVTGKSDDGKSDDGKPDDGKPATKKYPKVVEDQGLVDQDQTPPTPQARQTPAQRADQSRKTGGESDHLENQPPDPVDALAAELADKTGWNRSVTAAVLAEQVAENRRPWPVIERVMRRVAADPLTQGPSRIRVVPAQWWMDAARPEPKPKPAWCGECDDGSRLRESALTPGAMTRCPACHPQSVSSAA